MQFHRFDWLGSQCLQCPQHACLIQMIYSEPQSLFMCSKAYLVMIPLHHVSFKDMLLMYLDIIIFNGGLCFLGTLCIWNSLYHVSCTLQLSPMGTPLLFVLGYLNKYGYAPPTSFQIMYSIIKGELYHLSRSRPLHSFVLPSIASTLSLSL